MAINILNNVIVSKLILIFVFVMLIHTTVTKGRKYEMINCKYIIFHTFKFLKSNTFTNVILSVCRYGKLKKMGSEKLYYLPRMFIICNKRVQHYNHPVLV